VDTLVLCRSGRVPAKLVGLFGIHAENFGKCEQSCVYKLAINFEQASAYVPYEWKADSHANIHITPSFLRCLFRHFRKYLFLPGQNNPGLHT
jgi:hypothetical protein